MTQPGARRPRISPFVLLALVFALPNAASAQRVSLRVFAADSSPLRTATISVGNAGAARAVDSTGRIAIDDLALRSGLRLRAVGYRSVELTGDSLQRLTAESDSIRIVLDALSPLLGAVEVTSDRPALGGARITRDVATRLPPLGEPDILRVLPLIGGIAQPNDIRPRLHLAGAAGDESLVTLDGHPLQHGLHSDGLLGAFNLSALERADVLMHSVPAAARSRVGGVIAIEPRIPGATSEGTIGVSLAAANATVAAPVGKVNLLASARSTWNGALLERVLNGTPTPGFRDGLLQVAMPLGGGTDLGIIGFAARNAPSSLASGTRIGIETTESLIGATARRSLLGGQWAMRVSQSQFRTEQRGNAVATGDPEARQEWIAASLDARWRAERNWLDAHLSLDARDHEHRWNRSRTDNLLLPSSFGQRVQQRLSHAALAAGTGAGRWSLDAGSRLTRSSVGTWFAPQANLQWHATSAVSAGASVGRRWQFDSQYGEPAAGGDPPPVFLLTKPRRMDAAAVSLAWSGAERADPLDLRVEMTAFARRFAERSIPPRSTTPFTAPTSGTDSLDFVRTSGRAHGVSTTASWRSANAMSVQLAYTWQRAWQRDSIYDARAAWDIPHTLSALVSYPLTQRLELSGVVSWRSGTAVTPVVGAVVVPVNQLATFRPRSGELNAARLPEYLRLDAMLRWYRRISRADVALTLQVINVLGRENVMGYRLDAAGSFTGGTLLPPPDTGVPFLPSLGVEIRW